MLRLFTENRLFAVLLLPVVLVGYFYLNIYFPYFETSSDLKFGLFGNYAFESIMAKKIGGLVFVLINAFGLNIIFNHYNFFEKNTSLPAIIYIVWMSFFEGMYNPDGFLLSHSLLILTLFQLFKLNQNEDGRKIAFNIGFLIGLASCLHFTLVIYLPLMILILWMVRPFVLRELLLVFTGFIIAPIYAGVLYLFNHQNMGVKWHVEMIFIPNQQIALLFIAALIFLFILISVVGIRTKLSKSSIRFRKLIRMIWLLFFTAVIIGVVDLLLFQETENFSLIFVVLPFFSFFAFLKRPLSLMANILFGIVFVCSILKFFL